VKVKILPVIIADGALGFNIRKKIPKLWGVLEGAKPPLSSLSPSPRMERGIQGVRLI
jgi:hypothetical protein